MANHPPAPEKTTMATNSENNPFTRYTRFWHRLSVYQQRGVLALIALVFIVMVFGYKSTPEMTGGARLIRDAVIFCAGVFGILLTVRRLELAERRLLDDRFANAVELMAKDIAGNNPKPAIAARIGGIYIMANLAKQKPKEFAEQVVINLIAYIKDNAQKTATPELKEGETPDNPRTLGGDVKAAFSVLSDILRDKAIDIDERVLDFSQCNFSGLDFRGVDLSHYKKWNETRFIGCDLTEVRFADGADMRKANFSGATLKWMMLKCANLCCADFRGADMAPAIMMGSYMGHAKLQQADNGKNTDLEGAALSGANLEQANLSGANMNLTDLRAAVLYRANLTGVQNLLPAILRWTGVYYMIDAIIDEPDRTKLSLRAKHNGGDIWIDAADVARQNSDSPNKTNWQLTGDMDGCALAGTLFNFANPPFPGNIGSFVKEWTFPSGETENIEQQFAMLERVSEDTPDNIKKWHKEIRAKYSGR